MYVRASVHTCGLRPGESAELNGNDPAVRAALAAGYLERVSDDDPGVPAGERGNDVEVEQGDANGEDATEGGEGQGD